MGVSVGLLKKEGKDLRESKKSSRGADELRKGRTGEEGAAGVLLELI